MERLQLPDTIDNSTEVPHLHFYHTKQEIPTDHLNDRANPGIYALPTRRFNILKRQIPSKLHEALPKAGRKGKGQSIYIAPRDERIPYVPENERAIFIAQQHFTCQYKRLATSRLRYGNCSFFTKNRTKYPHFKRPIRPDCGHVYVQADVLQQADDDDQSMVEEREPEVVGPYLCGPGYNCKAVERYLMEEKCYLQWKRYCRRYPRTERTHRLRGYTWMLNRNFITVQQLFWYVSSCTYMALQNSRYAARLKDLMSLEWPDNWTMTLRDLSEIVRETGEHFRDLRKVKIGNRRQFGHYMTLTYKGIYITSDSGLTWKLVGRRDEDNKTEEVAH